MSPSISHRPSASRAAMGALLALAVGYATLVVWRRALLGLSAPNLDSYGYFYPNVLYARDALARGGEGLLWNRYQNCGQPFLGISLTGALYPLNAVFLLGADRGLLVLLILHLFVAAAGMFLLCRELELSTAASLCGAIAFQFGGTTLFLASWMPTILASYVWFPLALFLVERLLRRPGGWSTVSLAVVTAVQITAGYPQFSLFIYMTIGLRLVWEVVSTRGRLDWSGPAAVVGGLVVGPALAAVQLLPAIQTASVSVRNLPLSMKEIFTPGDLAFPRFREALGQRRHFASVLAVAVLPLAALAPFDRRRWRFAVFYLAASVLFMLLAFDTPVLRAYLKLPGAHMFRSPSRFLLIPGVTLAVLCGIGANWATEAHRRRRILHLVPPLAVLSVFYFLSPPGLLPVEWAVAAVMLAALLFAARRPSSGPAISGLLPVLVCIGLVGIALHPFSGIWIAKSRIFDNADLFARLRGRMTLQDRVFLLGAARDYGLMDKAASVFRVASVSDYETQTSRRYAELMVRLRTGAVLRSINQFYFAPKHKPPRNDTILDALGARYLVVDTVHTKLGGWPENRATLLWRQGPIAVYENERALPRAFFVSQWRAAAGPDQSLELMSSGAVDLRRVVLLEGPPPDRQPRVDPAPAPARVEILRDTGETVTIDVVTSTPGFLVLMDQDYPGWGATVNGNEVPIRRANHAFRAVEVPGGRSVVVFRYRPRSLLLGAAISGLAVLALIAAALFSRRRSRSAAPV